MKIFTAVSLLMAAIGMCALGYNWFAAEEKVSHLEFQVRVLEAELVISRSKPALAVLCDGFTACTYLINAGTEVVNVDSVEKHAAAWKRLDDATRKCNAELQKEIQR
jgi:hypothetical protein